MKKCLTQISQISRMNNPYENANVQTCCSRCSFLARLQRHHSHSMVAGGLELMS
jgi:hypothetical protein